MGKKRTKKIPKKQLWVIGLTAAAMLVVTVSVFYVIFGHYDGLGLAREVAENQYNMSNLSKSKGLRHYEDEQYESIAGIDVSFYQKKIDWEQVKASGIEFAIIRVGFRGSKTGELQLDDRFKENIEGAKAAGIDVGVYFFSQAITTEEAIKEARFVLRHIKGKGVEYPVVFDMEPIHGSNRINKLTTTEKTEIADAFCELIERNGYEPMIYGNPTWLNQHIDLSYLTKYEVWLAHYAETTDYPWQYRIWQYTDRGKVKGIKGRVDLNIYFKEK
ncbi:lysozyme [Clostridiales Family XIII bacterium PM5-7]